MSPWLLRTTCAALAIIFWCLGARGPALHSRVPVGFAAIVGPPYVSLCAGGNRQHTFLLLCLVVSPIQ